MELWYTEKHTSNLGITMKIKETLTKEKSVYQEMVILDTFEYGKLMLLDGLVMLTEKDEFVYHEMISHIPLYSHPNPKKVLIIGGGDGGTLREVCKHPSVEKAVLVEIDDMVIEGAKKYFPECAKGFESPKADVQVTDGIKYIEETEDRFDVIIVDSTDPIGPAEGLFHKKFYEMCKGVLTEDGILVAQGESPFISSMQRVVTSMNKDLEEVFPNVQRYLAFIPTYPSGMWSFVFASKKYNALSDFDKERCEKDSFDLKYYNAEIHQAAFALPNFVKELIK